MRMNYRALGVMALLAVATVGLVTLGAISPEQGIGGGFFSAAAVQTAYSENIRKAVAGMIANMTTYNIDTRINETEAGIGFGLAVGKGTADKGAVIGGAANTFLGVTVRDVTLVEEDEDKYPHRSNMAVLTMGDIWVTVGGNVADGENVTFNTTTGVLSSIAADGSNIAITGARWMTTALSGELAVLRLTGALPSA
jgi:hypothetical protein